MRQKAEKKIMSSSFSQKVNVTEQVDTTVSVYNERVYVHLQTTKGGKWKSISLTAPEFAKLVKTIPKIQKLVRKASQKLKSNGKKASSTKTSQKKDKKKTKKEKKTVSSGEESSSAEESLMDETSSDEGEQ